MMLSGENEIKINDELSSFITSDNIFENFFNSFSNYSNHDTLFINNHIFSTCEKNEENKGNEIALSKKRCKGRKIIGHDIKIKTHNKFYTDNLLRKVQNHFINFIVSFMNEILNQLGFNQRFCCLSYRFKFNVTKQNIMRLRYCTIGEILSNDISPKYIKKCPDFNIKVINELKSNRIINLLLSENYLYLFKNVYYKSKRIINLQKYGFNKTLILSEKIKMYKDLLTKNNNLNIKDNCYQKRMNECVTRNYLLDAIFLCN